MSDETTSTNIATASAPAPNAWQSILSKIVKPKSTGVDCEYCGWHGTMEQVMRSPRLNEDGAVYQITTCPRCMRNGGLDFHED